MTLTAYLLLMFAGLFGLCVALRHDVYLLQAKEFDNRSYNGLLKQRREFTSARRLLALAVLMGSATTMARDSWIVTLVLAVVMAAQGVGLLLNRRGKCHFLTRRGWRLYIATVVLSLLAIELTGYLGSRESETIAAQAAAMVSLLLLAASPLLAMACNLLLCPIEKKIYNNV